jgi:Ca-activated chloride channel family protein
MKSRSPVIPVLIVVAVVLFSALGGADPVYQRYKTGEKQYERQEYEEALNSFVDAQLEVPEDPRLTYDIANTHYKMKNFEEAAKSYLSVAGRSPDMSLEEQAYYNLGNCMYRQGKLVEAVDYYKKALDLDPDDEDAKHNLEFVREEIKRRQNQEKQRQQQQETQPSQSEKPPDREQSQPDQQRNNQEQAQDNAQTKSGTGKQEEEEQREQPAYKGEQEEAQGQESGQEQKQTAPSRPMTQEEAERWLKTLNEDQRETLKKQVQRHSGGGMPTPEKDW